MANAVLEELWGLAAAEAEKRDDKPDYVFGKIGLFLEIPPVNWGCYPTPLNTSTFASTHGDSVHYGLIHRDGAATERSPVIMTVPCIYRGQANFVLGENLREFLCLGCEVGYFSLEQLAYSQADFYKYLAQPEMAELEEDDKALLNSLTRAFSLKSWMQAEVRLAQLHAQYHSLLELPPDE